MGYQSKGPAKGSLYTASRGLEIPITKEFYVDKKIELRCRASIETLPPWERVVEIQQDLLTEGDTQAQTHNLSKSYFTFTTAIILLSLCIHAMSLPRIHY